MPGIGAFSVRSRWRTFRRRLLKATTAPILTYREIRDTHVRQRQYRFFGALESIQHDRELSLRGGELTVAADMTHSEIYVLPRDTGGLPDEPPFRTTWARLGSVTEGTKVFVAGELHESSGSAVVGGNAGDPLLVILYDGSERNLVRRCIWSGRQLNEYWNQLTPVALAAGTLALITIAYVLLRSPANRVESIAALALASLPLLPLVPPGVVFFFAYRRTWRRGRILRAHRDVLLLPLGRGPDHQVAAAGEVVIHQVAERDQALAYVSAGAHFQQPPIPLETSVFSIIGVPGGDPGQVPRDPMVEPTVVPGDPEQLSERCQHLARTYELVSVGVLGAGLLANLVGVFILLQYLVR